MSLRAQNRILAILLGVLAVFAATALVLPGAWGATGIAGLWLRESLFEAVGPLSAWILPSVLGLLAVNRWKGSSLGLFALRSAVLCAFATAIAAALGLFGG